MENQTNNLTAPNTLSLLKRADLYLEDGEFESATEYYNRVLDIDPECAKAYLGLLMAELKIKEHSELTAINKPLTSLGNFKRALRFADDELRKTLEEYDKQNTTNSKKTSYHEARKLKESAQTKEEYMKAAEELQAIGDYRDAEDLALECIQLAYKAEDSEDRGYTAFGDYKEKEQIFQNALSLMNEADSEETYMEAEKEFLKIPNYRSSEIYAKRCREKAGSGNNHTIPSFFKSLTDSNSDDFNESVRATGNDSLYAISLICGSIKFVICIILFVYCYELAEYAKIAGSIVEYWGDGFHWAAWIVFVGIAGSASVLGFGEIKSFITYSKNKMVHNLDDLKKKRKNTFACIMHLLFFIMAIMIMYMPDTWLSVRTIDEEVLLTLRWIALTDFPGLSFSSLTLIVVSLTVVNAFQFIVIAVRIFTYTDPNEDKDRITRTRTFTGILSAVIILVVMFLSSFANFYDLNSGEVWALYDDAIYGFSDSNYNEEFLCEECNYWEPWYYFCDDCLNCLDCCECY